MKWLELWEQRAIDAGRDRTGRLDLQLISSHLQHGDGAAACRSGFLEAGTGAELLEAVMSARDASRMMSSVAWCVPSLWPVLSASLYSLYRGTTDYTSRTDHSRSWQVEDLVEAPTPASLRAARVAR